MRYAAPPALLSSNPALTLLVVVFIAGALLFALGTLMLRRESKEQKPGSINTSSPAVSASSPGVILSLSKDELEARIDHIERLAMVAQPWCITELREMLTDSDSRVRNAAENALLVISARG